MFRVLSDIIEVLDQGDLAALTLLDHGSYSQGKSGNFKKSGKIQTVRGSQGIQKYHGAKVNKDAEKNRTVARTLNTAVQNFFCSLRSQIIYTFTFSFVLPPLFLVLLQVIESQHWYFA